MNRLNTSTLPIRPAVRSAVYRTAANNGQPVQTEQDDPTAQAQNANGTPDNAGDNTSTPAGVSFTPEQQNVIDGIVAERVARAEKKAREAEAERRKREGMEEGERLKAEIADAQRERDEAIADARRARHEAQLAPHVVDPAAAVLLLEQDAERYTDAAGKVKVDAFLKDKPYLRRETPRQTGPGAGGKMGEAADPKKDLGAALAADRAAGRRR